MTFKTLHHLTQLYQAVYRTPGGTIYTVVYEVMLKGHHSCRSTYRRRMDGKVNPVPGIVQWGNTLSLWASLLPTALHFLYPIQSATKYSPLGIHFFLRGLYVYELIGISRSVLGYKKPEFKSENLVLIPGLQPTGCVVFKSTIFMKLFLIYELGIIISVLYDRVSIRWQMYVWFVCYRVRYKWKFMHIV